MNLFNNFRSLSRKCQFEYLNYFNRFVYNVLNGLLVKKATNFQQINQCIKIIITNN